MFRFLTGFSICCAISACDPATETVYIVPVVPEELRTPVEVPKRQAKVLQDVGLILTDHVEALATANDKIITTDCILDAAEAGEDASYMKE